MEMNFQKTERGFCSERAEEQKTLPYFAQVPPVGRIKAIFQPLFSVFRFFLFSVLILRDLFRRDGDEIGETEGGFCP
jgi:hypothetical protein